MNSDRRAAAKDACERAGAAIRGGDPCKALRLYEYALRLAPSDAEITLAVGAARLRQMDRRCIEAFTQVALRDDLLEAWLGLTAAYHALGENARAANHLRVSLSRHGHMRNTSNLHLYDSVTAIHGTAGWCGLSADGKLRVSLLSARANIQQVAICLDDAPLAIVPQRLTRDGERRRALYPLPPMWRQAGRIFVRIRGRDLLGSPLEASVIGEVEGFVAASHGGLTGWAWFPRDPACAPVLVVKDAGGTTLSIPAEGPAPDVEHEAPFARPRRIHVPAEDLYLLRPPISVQDAAARNLYGSPLDPQADMHNAAGAAELTRRLFPGDCHHTVSSIDLRSAAVPADIMGARPSRRVSRQSAIDVVIPVYRGHDRTLACIDSVLATLPALARCVVVEDASPETALVDALKALADRGRILLQCQPENRGFAATANVGIRAGGDRDIILLNSDTLVPRGWIERLAAAAYSAGDIGTATPLSNDATIFSYPREDARNPVPDAAALLRFDHLARRANGRVVIEVPTAHGFCVYLRRDCLNSVGLFREDLFAQGYGEENDFSIRARHLGWRHVAVPGVFVAHEGAVSFGSGRTYLMARNLAVLNRVHTGYDALIADFRQADPLAQARLRMDALRWRRRCSRKGAVVLITHARTGGVQRRLAERHREIVAAGLRPIVLAPGREPDGRVSCRLFDESGEDFPNLRFDISNGVAELAEFLRADKPVHIELHHFIGHDPAILGLAYALNVPYDVVLHDYAWVCPRITLVGPDKRYCGEPGEDACEACYADIGTNIEEDITPLRLRRRSQRLFVGARRIVVPSRDAATRLQRYFPRITCVVTPWENDGSLAPRLRQRTSTLHLRVVVVGAIGVDKGYEYLLACARHVAARRLALEFVVVGHTCDDKRLLDTGVVSITGHYEEAEAVELIRAQQAELGFLPALWPETWSYVLSQIWQAGLDVVAFDLGAPAERIRATGRGSLLPLGLSPAAACRRLLTYHAT